MPEPEAHSTASLWIVGDSRHTEFRDSLTALDAYAPALHFDTLPEVLSRLSAGAEPPELVVAVQSRPGQFDAGDWNQLALRAPLARCIVVLGSWCEGETRSGQIWPGALRVYGYQAPAFFACQFERVRHGQLPAWATPITASDDERWLWVDNYDSEPSSASPSPRAVLVQSASNEIARWLSAGLRRGGFEPRRVPFEAHVDASDAVAGVFDFTFGSEEEWAKLARLVDSLKGLPAIALSSFPRWEDRQRARCAGVAVLAGKPLTWDELQWHLRAVLSD